MRSAAWLLSLSLLGCGDGDLRPSTGTLSGMWFHDETLTERTIFVFVPAAEAATLDLDGVSAPPGKDVSLVYVASSINYLPILKQVATFEVHGNTLTQTVVADVGALPGTQYETDILALDEDMLQLESNKDPSGSRAYTRVERCPSENIIGWSTPFVSPDDTSLAAQTLSLTDDGTLYGIDSGLVQVHGTRCQDPPFALPTGGYSNAALAMRGAEVHLLLQRPGGALEYFERTTDAWGTGEPVAPVPASGQPAYNMELFVDGDELVAAIARADGVTDIFRRTGGGWARVPVVFPSPQRMEDVELAPDGSLVFLSLRMVHRVAGTSVTETALPGAGVDSGELSASLVVDEQNRVHVGWNNEQLASSGMVYSLRGAYSILDGTTWTTYDLGDAPYPRVLRPAPDALRVIHGTAKASAPGYALTELSPEDGKIVSSRLITTSGTFGGGLSPSPGARVLGVRSADGAIATTLPGQLGTLTFYKPATSITPPLRTQVTIQVNGQGRVFTEDGQIDCTGTCTLEVPWGTRFPLHAEPAPGYQPGNVLCDTAFTGLDECWYEVTPRPYNEPFTLQFGFVPRN